MSVKKRIRMVSCKDRVFEGNDTADAVKTGVFAFLDCGLVKLCTVIERFAVRSGTDLPDLFAGIGKGSVFDIDDHCVDAVVFCNLDIFIDILHGFDADVHGGSIFTDGIIRKRRLFHRIPVQIGGFSAIQFHGTVFPVFVDLVVFCIDFQGFLFRWDQILSVDPAFRIFSCNISKLDMVLMDRSVGFHLVKTEDLQAVALLRKGCDLRPILLGVYGNRSPHPDFRFLDHVFQ